MTHPAPASPTARGIGILLFDDVEELDAVGPWEVLSYWTRTFAEDGWTVFLLSADGLPVRAAKGMVIGAHFALADAPPMDVVLHPGGFGTRQLMVDDAHLDWVRAQRDVAALMTSVCTGSLVYAAAGLLAGRPATTHWSALAELAAADPSIEIRPDDRYVDDGDVITSAGCRPGSTWPCTSSCAWPVPIGPARSVVEFSTTLRHRSEIRIRAVLSEVRHMFDS